MKNQPYCIIKVRVVIKRNKIIISITIGVVILSSILLGTIIPLRPRNYGTFTGESLIANTAATFKITTEVETNFGTYIPEEVDFTPQVPYKEIVGNLANVDLQGITLTTDLKNQIATYGFALEELSNFDLIDLYLSTNEHPYFVSTDICLHLFHLMYDFSLKMIEVNNFYDSFYTMLNILREDQKVLYFDLINHEIKSDLERNIAFLSVMMYFLDEDWEAIDEIGQDLAIQEIYNIGNLTMTFSSIFNYLEMFELYQVRGHYNDHPSLPNYFKAMMYAGRMGFLLNSVPHTRMTMLLISSFNATIEDENYPNIQTIWDFWEQLYEPTVFYIGESDDLTARECSQILTTIGSPEPYQFDNATVEEFMLEAQNYRSPKINSMFISNMDDYDIQTFSFRLFGQRFVPDNYIFQQLMHPNVLERGPPKGLDVFSVFGSPRADLHLTDQGSYFNYNNQINNLRAEFGELNETYWTQNLYWLWLYSLFPLLQPATVGYPALMQSDAWTDKALMTVMSSWTELKHDTILYAKYPYTAWGITPSYYGYVEPYPELYARLSSLAQYLYDGLMNFGLATPDFLQKLSLMKNLFSSLKEISIKELSNEKLTDSEMDMIVHFGWTLAKIYFYTYADMEITKDRSAIIADVAGANGYVLEVAVGNPCKIYVVIPDNRGRLKLTYGAVFSYYEFEQLISNILNDETWQDMLDTNPPPKPNWILDNIPIITTTTSMTVIVALKKRIS
ncbi:MAG: DUF3160 domain-containing protein [Asgard group archaeon]|nr:DUF3160 domain-containing protein [Asgard group archaeon]